MSNLSQTIARLKTLQESYDSLSTSHTSLVTSYNQLVADYNALVEGGGGGGGASIEEIQEAINTAISQTDSTTAIREKVADVLHTTISSTTATYNAIERIATNIANIYTIMGEMNYDVTGKDIEHLVEAIKVAVDYYPPVTIEGEDGKYYTLEEWNAYKSAHDGAYPTTCTGIAIRTPMQSFCVGLDQGTSTAVFGANESTSYQITTKEAGSTSIYAWIKNSLMFDAEYNTIHILMHYAADTAPEPWCLKFGTKAELDAYGSYQLEVNQVYYVRQDETHSNAGALYTWDGSSLVYRGTGHTTGYDNNPARLAYNYTLGGKQWYLPTIAHCVLVYSYLSQVNLCLEAVGATKILTSAQYWTCHTTAYNFATSFNFATGGGNTGNNRTTARLWHYKISPL